MNTEFSRAYVGVELAGTRDCGKAGFANCDTRKPGINSQRQNGLTAGETALYWR